MVEHVKSFSPRFREEGPGEPLAVPEAPPETPELVALGEAAWRRNGCEKCHGETGRGRRPVGSDAAARRRQPHPAAPLLRRALPSRGLAARPLADAGHRARRHAHAILRRHLPGGALGAGRLGPRPRRPDRRREPGRSRPIAEEQIGWRIDIEER